MKWIKYQILQSAVGEQIVLANKKVGYNAENLAIAQSEAYDGYEIIDDEQSFEKEPLAIEFGGTGAKNAEDAKRNLGIDAGGGVFIAKYGETTFAEIEEAHTSGKLVVCQMNVGNEENPEYVDMALTSAVVETIYMFGVCNNTSALIAYITIDGNWVSVTANGFTPAEHTHETSEITDFPTSMTPTVHNQAASTITAGTFAGRVQGNASAMATISNAQFRDIKAGTTDLTAGESYLATGTLYFVYE